MKCFVLFALLCAVRLACAAVCNPNELQGAYGLSLTGNTSIGGANRPVAVVGRLVLDGSGVVNGVSSVAFTGLVLGNPVTGSYEAHSDCSVTWTLQDDSGNWQHFTGTMSSGGARVTFRQTDEGGAEDGLLLRTPDMCAESSLQGRFKLTLSGSTVDVDSGQDAGRISIGGVLQADGAGGLSFASGSDTPMLAVGTYDFQDGCFVELTLRLAAANGDTREMRFRGILGDNGGTVLGIQVDPGRIVSLRLVSQ